MGYLILCFNAKMQFYFKIMGWNKKEGMLSDFSYGRFLIINASTAPTMAMAMIMAIPTPMIYISV